MSSKERFESALRLEQSDYVPIAPHLGGYNCFSPIAAGYTLADICVADSKKMAKMYLKCYEKYPADWIYPIGGKDTRWFKERSILRVKEGYQVTDLKTGEKEFFSDWEEHRWVLKSFSLEETLEMLEKEAEKTPEEIIKSGQLQVLEILNEKKGKEIMVTGAIGGVTGRAANLTGMEKYLLNLIEKPDILQKLFQKMVDISIAHAHALHKIGIKFISICEYLSGADVISPETYRKVILPYHRQLLERVPKGVYTCFEIGGNIIPIIEEIIATGVSCIWPEMPLRGYDILDIENIVEHIKGRVAIISNFDAVGLLIRGSKEEIESEVKRMLKIGKNTPGFILGTGCSIAWNTPQENVEHFLNFAKKYRQEA